MNSAHASRPGNTSALEPSSVVRNAVQSLNRLDRETADFLSALSFVLMRVAWADGTVCCDERLRMEEILVEHAGLAPEHAVLVTEIASHRTQIADCGSAYWISRRLRADLDADRRRAIVRLLAAVADADGCSRTVERREIEQIAREIGISA